ncbi:hypothetical protein [Demetria terragena]|uniref:hypothetical protein n=1 Tax=Demetria terragena TaxID=63959 RepID=UPI00035F4469|nr:hypothetical protein [Demetria terragena]
MRIRILVLAVLATLLTAAPAAAFDLGRVSPPAPRWDAGQVVEVGAVRVAGIPTALGTPQVFASQGDDDEQIETAVWERRAGDGWQVAGSATVVRAPWLAGASASVRWFIAWQERPAAEAVYRRVTLANGGTAWVAKDQIIWQPEPGAIASVRLHRHFASVERFRRIAGWSTVVG